MNKSKSLLWMIISLPLALGILTYIAVVHFSDELALTEIISAVQTLATLPETGDEDQFSFNASAEPWPLPRLNFLNGGGRAIDLEAFRGKVVLLNIWATWCIPCRKEMPALDRLQAHLGGVNFEVVAVSIDRAGLASVRDFYDELGLRFLAIYIDPSMDISSSLRVVGIPTTLLINREGKEIGRVIGPVEWDSPAVIEAIRKYLPPN